METDMSNGKPGNFHWKNKLEDVDGLTGETLADKNATWEKLHNRLRQKPRRIKALRYWAAAACLLSATIIGIKINNLTLENLVNNYPAENQLKKANVTEMAPPAGKKSVATISPLTPKKKKINIHIVESDNKRSFVSNRLKKEEILPVKLLVSQHIKEEPIVSAPIIESTRERLLAEAPVKKKLKVIHINEIGDLDEENSNIVRYTERHSFKVKLINQEVYTGVSLPSGYTGFNFFKTKISPSN